MIDDDAARLMATHIPALMTLTRLTSLMFSHPEVITQCELLRKNHNPGFLSIGITSPGIRHIWPLLRHESSSSASWLPSHSEVAREYMDRRDGRTRFGDSLTGGILFNIYVNAPHVCPHWIVTLVRALPSSLFECFTVSSSSSSSSTTSSASTNISSSCNSSGNISSGDTKRSSSSFASSTAATTSNDDAILWRAAEHYR